MGPNACRNVKFQFDFNIFRSEEIVTRFEENSLVDFFNFFKQRTLNEVQPEALQTHSTRIVTTTL